MLDKIKNFFTWLFTLIGLVLVLIGSVGFLNLALKVYVFPKADRNYCPPPAIGIYRKTIPPEIDYYQQCLENQQSQRQKEAAQNLALLITGFPVLFFFYKKTK